MKKLTLKNFAEESESFYYRMGKSYFFGDQISNFKIRNNTYYALIHGLDDYKVSVTLKEEDEIINTTCECAAKTPLCDHVVGLLFKIKAKKYHDKKVLKEAGNVANKERFHAKLMQKLMNKQPEELSYIIYKISADSFVSQNRALILSDEKISSSTLKDIFLDYFEIYHHRSELFTTVNLLLTLIKEEKDNDREQLRALLTMYMIVDDAAYDDSLLSDDEYDPDDFYFDDELEYHEMLDGEKRGEDDGHDENALGDYVLMDIAYVIKDKLDYLEKHKRKLDRELLAEIREFFDYIFLDFYFPPVQIIFDALYPFARDKKVYELLLSYLQAELSDPLYLTLTSEDNYVLEYLFDLISTFHPQDIQKYVAKYITYIPFREHLIAHEIGEGNYESALFKINEGNDYLKANGVKNSVVFTKFLEIIYREFNDISRYRGVLITLMRHEFDEYHYNLYRDTFTDKAWHEHVDTFLTKIKNSANAYSHALIQEERWDDVLAHALTSKKLTISPLFEYPASFHEVVITAYQNKINDYLTTRKKPNYMYLDHMFIVLRFLMDAVLFDKYIDDLIVNFPTKKSLENYVRSPRFLN